MIPAVDEPNRTYKRGNIARAALLQWRWRPSGERIRRLTRFGVDLLHGRAQRHAYGRFCTRSYVRRGTRRARRCPTIMNDSAATGAPAWSLPRRVGLRVLFCYFGLFFFPPPLPGLDAFSAWWNGGCVRLTQWIALHVLHLGTLEIRDDGSADTTAAWLQLGWSLALAVVGGVVWALADWRRRDDRLAALGRLYLRYALGLVMITFGLVKIMAIQFPPLTPMRLFQRIGDQSPMGLLWTFMAYSPAYNWFAGGLELAGALLLLFRRTVALGAFLTLAAMTQVVLLNFCYDVPVKTLAVHLWLAALVLLWPALRRLLTVLTTADAPIVTIQRRRLRLAAVPAHVAFVAVVLGTQLRGLSAFKAAFLGGTPPSLSGAWQVEHFVRDGQPIEVGEPTGWRRVGLDHGELVVQLGSDAIGGRYRATADEAAHTLAVRAEPDDGRAPVTLRYRLLAGGQVELDGTLDGRAVQALLRKLDTSDMVLVSRSFHWVSETYYNR